MRPVLKRIAVNGALTALLLAMIGYGFAELAGLWLAAQPADRGPAPAAPANPDVAADLRTRVPLAMGLSGFLFVAVGELGLHFWRSRRPVVPPPPPGPDPAEVLLEELLRQVEAQQAKPPEPAPSSSPSVPEAENIHAPRPAPHDRPA